MRDLAAARLTSACLESKIGGFGIYRIDRDFAEESRNFSPAGPAFLEKTRAYVWINSRTLG